MLPKPASITRVGVIQSFLALSFVIWLLFFPDSGKNFAWPVLPRLTAQFLGASFILRVFLGFHLWRERLWYRLRWIKWGNFAFLGVILLATFWHVDQMNWKTNLPIAHLWVLAYILEPLILVLIEPHTAESNQPIPPELSSGPISPELKGVLAAVFVIGVSLAGLLMINPGFMNTRWPWPLDPFDARVMAAWQAGVGVWAASMYFSKDWAEIKIGVQALLLYAVTMLLLWVFTFSSYDPSHPNGITFGVLAAVSTGALGYCYWRQEQARLKDIPPRTQIANP